MPSWLHYCICIKFWLAIIISMGKIKNGRLWWLGNVRFSNCNCLWNKTFPTREFLQVFRWTGRRRWFAHPKEKNLWFLFYPRLDDFLGRHTLSAYQISLILNTCKGYWEVSNPCSIAIHTRPTRESRSGRPFISKVMILIHLCSNRVKRQIAMEQIGNGIYNHFWQQHWKELRNELFASSPGIETTQNHQNLLLCQVQFVFWRSKTLWHHLKMNAKQKSTKNVAKNSGFKAQSSRPFLCHFQRVSRQIVKIPPRLSLNEAFNTIKWNHFWPLKKSDIGSEHFANVWDLVPHRLLLLQS